MMLQSNHDACDADLASSHPAFMPAKLYSCDESACFAWKALLWEGSTGRSNTLCKYSTFTSVLYD